MLRSRVDTSANGTSTHFDVYGFIPDVLSSHPLFGLGLNNFSVYYEFVTGRTNFGPHSFYVATLVETGLVGTALFVAFLVYLFKRLGRLRAIGRALAARRAIRPLAWGMTAALVGTIAANAFYLTMSFYYFFAFALLALAAPIVFARRLDVKVVVLTTSYPRDERDVAGALRPRRGRGACGRRASRSRSSRRRRSGTSGSRTGTGSPATCAGGRGSRCCCRRSSSTTRGRRDGRRGTPTSCTRTGCRPRWRR